MVCERVRKDNFPCKLFPVYAEKEKTIQENIVCGILPTAKSVHSRDETALLSIAVIFLPI
jgi:hypothetical protein